jgi:hypothetical protein
MGKHRVIVCGGRDFADERFVREVLDDYDAEHGIARLAHGGATGADSLAGAWARDNHLVPKVYRANWLRDGRAAGPIRNQQMLDAETPDVVIAFPGGAGTADMKRRARKAGVRVVEFAPGRDHELQPLL